MGVATIYYSIYQDARDLNMNVEIINSKRGWQVTENVARNLKRHKDHNSFLQDAYVVIQSNVMDFLKNEAIYDSNSYIIVEDNYNLIDQKICLCAVVSITEVTFKDTAKVYVELHMMMQDEYKEGEDAGIKLA